MGIQNGSKVSIHYAVKVDGVLVDTSKERGPLSYVQGEGQIVPGLEGKLLGMEVGERKSVTVTPEEGYGPREDEAVKRVPRAAFADVEQLQVGSIVQGSVEGQAFQAVVMAIDASDVTLDLNHPLAGKTLEFDVEVVAIEGIQKD